MFSCQDRCVTGTKLAPRGTHRYCPPPLSTPARPRPPSLAVGAVDDGHDCCWRWRCCGGAARWTSCHKAANIELNFFGYSASPWLGILIILPLGYSKIERWTWLSYKNSAHGEHPILKDSMNSSYPPADYSHLPPHPSLDHTRLVMSTWHVLEQVSIPSPPFSPFPHLHFQPPPPSLREILGAYRSKGDGDRDMLIAMLNAKSAEDQVGAIPSTLSAVLTYEQRMAAVASLHRTLLDLYTTDAKISPAPLQHYPLSSPHINSPKDKRHTLELSNGHESAFRSAPSSREPPHHPQPPRKRQRFSRSPALSSHPDACSSNPSSRDLPPSPYSSRSDSEEYSPRSRTSMAIGSLLSSGAGRDSAPDDSQNAPDVSQTRFSSSAIGVSV